MVLIAVFLPALMLMVLVALARYEELMLGGDEPAETPNGRHLVAVPDLPEAGTPEPDRVRPYGAAVAQDRPAA
ncbi:hypothetical protein [Streptomyces sp. NBC_00083]|uniref:hypothetical protein n=1 Tax=Streptomyces sp. NBC_00083 TaxID=2975647 RepID=UPI0022551012|nr:hypothetical protein [Streptomyces sp. NBC_00083]MCX5387151.1 hypothetical protein [Streptomyces sp. NBC_00083]